MLRRYFANVILRKTGIHASNTLRNSSSLITPQKPYYVTSPIFYVNAAPHIGHLYSLIVADIFARWQRLRNPSCDVLYTTGTDEHGLKIQQAAQAQRLLPKELCDLTSRRFQELNMAAQASTTAFIRTTEERHRISVEETWNRLIQQGAIYKGLHSGWYAVSDEAFYTPAQVEKVVDSVTGDAYHRSRETGKLVVWTEEENYKFRLSSFREQLLNWITTYSPIKPSKRQDEVIQFLTDASSVQDISISRPRDRVDWGIPVPGDPNHTIYVWLDALTSYMTPISYPWKDGSTMRLSGWPTDLHVVGKDILRFHAVYFPAFLLALRLPLPKAILSHAHWTMSHQKMSKSIGNVVDPFQILTKYGIDSVRWYLARVGGNFVDDVDWSIEQLVKHHDRELRGLGNLYSRLHAPNMCDVDRTALPSASSENPLESQLVDSLISLSGEVVGHMDELAIGRALESILSRIDLVNRYFTYQAIWVSGNEELRGRTLALSREALRLCAILLQPFLPDRIPVLLDWLNVPKDQRTLIWASFGALQRVGGVANINGQNKLYEAIKDRS